MLLALFKENIGSLKINLLITSCCGELLFTHHSEEAVCAGGGEQKTGSHSSLARVMKLHPLCQCQCVHCRMIMVQ